MRVTRSAVHWSRMCGRRMATAHRRRGQFAGPPRVEDTALQRSPRPTV